MIWAFQHSANGFDKAISEYFQNCRTLEEIDQHKKMKAELNSLREKQKSSDDTGDRIIQQPIPELYEDESEESPTRLPNSRIHE